MQFDFVKLLHMVNYTVKRINRISRSILCYPGEQLINFVHVHLPSTIYYVDWIHLFHQVQFYYCIT